MQFAGTWRDYQQRVLDELAQHSDDDRIHVVAAPGSGKTVLGLELVRRLGRPAIILAPSITIRNQWAERLVPLFMPERPPDGFFSHSLERPGQLTGATYQALHAIWAEEGQLRFAALTRWAAEFGPLTLVLDEAHHLRREWWRALDALIAGLPDVHVVALTATPPYDAPLAEWQRYEAACGPIDIEIGIPELVHNGDLCPHQDHVLFSRPSEDLLALLDQRRAAVSGIVADLRADTGLLDALEHHPWLRDTDASIGAILDAPQILSAMLVHLAQGGRTLPKPPLKLLGVKAHDVPAQTGFWVETLFNALLYDLGDASVLAPPERKAWHDRLHRMGLIEGKRVRLGETQAILKAIAGDRSKLASIADIARAESAACGDRLRMVVLADHVRASELPKSAQQPWEARRIGVAPVFEMLRRLDLPDEHIAVLTGTLVIVPTAAVAALHRLGAQRGLAPAELRAVPLAHCGTHARIDASGHGKSMLVALVTELFQQGAITILVGTQALLGEGWDAPAINSLVLASNTASFMLSNQMRGRAIRIDPHYPGKVANIWHLATVERLPPESAFGQFAERLTWGAMAEGERRRPDLELLARRFDAFAGIANDDSLTIESGVARLRLSRHGTLDAANAATFSRADNRASVLHDWKASLGHAPPRAHVREIATPTYAPRRLSWHQTLEWLAIGGVSAGVSAASWQAAGDYGAPLLLVLAAAGAAGTVAALPKLARGVWLTARNGSLEGSVSQVAQTVLHMLVRDGTIDQVSADRVHVKVERSLDGSRQLHFEGLRRIAERAALGAVAEILGPIENPRYLLVRRSRLFGWGRVDYHAVPTQFGRNKALAESFAKEWRKRVGPSQLVATRSEEGRRMLLRARTASLAAGFQRRVDRRSMWL